MALYIVLDSKGDFSDISRNHLCLEQHKYFKPSAKFPDNVSDLLPPREDCWWEDLGKLLLSILFCNDLLIVLPDLGIRGVLMNDNSYT
jgi:hypothetical protein